MLAVPRFKRLESGNKTLVNSLCRFARNILIKSEKIRCYLFKYIVGYSSFDDFVTNIAVDTEVIIRKSFL